MTKFPACIRQECIVSPSDALLLGRCDQTGKRVDPRRLATRSRTWSPFSSPVFHVAIGYPCIWRLIVIDAGLTVITGVMYCRSKEQAFRFLADECETWPGIAWLMGVFRSRRVRFESTHSYPAFWSGLLPLGTHDSRTFEGKCIRTRVSEFDDCYVLFCTHRVWYCAIRGKWNVRNQMEICSAVKGELIQ